VNFDFGARTHGGQKRELNEDSYLAFPEQGLFVVCDGMGGHASGEVASQLACDEVRQFFELTSRDKDSTWPFRPDAGMSYSENRLAVAVKLANQSLQERSHNDASCRGMGTTFVGLFLNTEGNAVVAHAGDSRAYVLRKGTLRRLTNDHSLVEEFLRLGRITPEQARASAHKNVILRALGQQPNVDVEVHTHRPETGDIFLLCSDGLTGMLSDERVAEIVSKNPSSLDGAAQALVDEANAAGGLDNITVVLVRWPPI
jgi:protein phosphatase